MQKFRGEDKNAGPHPKSIGVNRGDHVYYEHPRLGAIAGKVLAHGKHGCTVEPSPGARHKVKWDSLHGHKRRADQGYALIEQGEDGLLLADKGGKRRFVSTVERDA